MSLPLGTPAKALGGGTRILTKPVSVSSLFIRPITEAPPLSLFLLHKWQHLSSCLNIFASNTICPPLRSSVTQILLLGEKKTQAPAFPGLFYAKKALGFQVPFAPKMRTRLFLRNTHPLTNKCAHGFGRLGTALRRGNCLMLCGLFNHTLRRLGHRAPLMR